METGIILSKEEIVQHIQEIADQIVAKHGSGKEIILIGIRTGGTVNLFYFVSCPWH